MERKNKPTNVLSFPNEESFQKLMLLGDIILAYETLKKEANEGNILFQATCHIY